MTRLDAINEILEDSNQPPVTTVDSTGTWPSLAYGASDAGQAERILDRECRRVLSHEGGGFGWFCNELRDYLVRLPTYRFGYAGADPAFTFGETLTQTGTGATLQLNRVDGANNFVYAGLITGTPNSAGVLTGGESAATVTPNALTILTETEIAYDPLWLKVRPAMGDDGEPIESKKISFRQTGASTYRIFDMDPSDSDVNPPYVTFDDGIRVDATKNLEFTTLPAVLAQYIVKVASVRFQRFLRGEIATDQMIIQGLAAERLAAMREDSDMRRVDIFDTNEASQMRGGRPSRRSELSI